MNIKEGNMTSSRGPAVNCTKSSSKPCMTPKAPAKLTVLNFSEGEAKNNDQESLFQLNNADSAYMEQNEILQQGKKKEMNSILTTASKKLSIKNINNGKFSTSNRKVTGESDLLQKGNITTNAENDLVIYESFEERSTYRQHPGEHILEDSPKLPFRTPILESIESLMLKESQQDLSQVKNSELEFKCEIHEEQLMPGNVDDMDDILAGTARESMNPLKNQSISQMQLIKNLTETPKILESGENTPKTGNPFPIVKNQNEEEQKEKTKEIEEIRRKALEKQQLFIKNSAAITIQKHFKRHKIQKNWKTIKENLLERESKKPNLPTTLKLKQKLAAAKIKRAYKKYRERKKEQEVIYQKYVNHCALFIQTQYRGYIIRRKYRPIIKQKIKFTHLRKALLKGWKIRNILKCKKMKNLAQGIKNILSSIGSLGKGKASNAEQLKQLRKKKVEDFIRLSKLLYLTGQWVQSQAKGKIKQVSWETVCHINVIY